MSGKVLFLTELSNRHWCHMFSWQDLHNVCTRISLTLLHSAWFIPPPQAITCWHKTLKNWAVKRVHSCLVHFLAKEQHQDQINFPWYNLSEVRNHCSWMDWFHLGMIFSLIDFTVFSRAYSKGDKKVLLLPCFFASWSSCTPASTVDQITALVVNDVSRTFLCWMLDEFCWELLNLLFWAHFTPSISICRQVLSPAVSLMPYCLHLFSFSFETKGHVILWGN